MKNFTDITVLVDRSGSMSTCREAMEAAFQTFIKENQAVPSTKLTLIQFDSVNPQQVIYQGVPVGVAEPLRITPRNMTPLVDAFCTAIDNTGRRLADMDEQDRPNKVLLVCITDGQENASNKFTTVDLRNKITNQTNMYNWQFVYLGANQDAFLQAQSFGIDWNKTIKWSTDRASVMNAGIALAGNTVSYTSGASGSSFMAFNDDQRVRSASVADISQDSSQDVSELVRKRKLYDQNKAQTQTPTGATDTTNGGSS